MNRSTLRRFHPTLIRYACSHEVTEDRGAMSDQLRAEVLAECAGRLCPECRARLLAVRTEEERRAQAESDKSPVGLMNTTWEKVGPGYYCTTDAAGNRWELIRQTFPSMWWVRRNGQEFGDGPISGPTAKQDAFALVERQAQP